jgi:hypothetical protein
LNTIHAVVEARLAEYLGPNTARNAVRTFARGKLGLEPDTLSVADLPRLSEALRPMLRTLLGAGTADAILARISEEAGA